MTHEILVNLSCEHADSYTITVGQSLYDFIASLPRKFYSTIVIITDNTVKKYYGLSLQKQLKKSGHKVLLLSFPAGERFKSSQTKQTIEHKMLTHACDRNTLILALGGGVTGDLAGYIAATYLRGIAYIQIPTTLLAMVDSSIGGKTGINTPHGKNLIGSIYQPKAVVADISLLKSLSKKNCINGLIEAIKMFLTFDAKSLDYTQQHLDRVLKCDKLILKEIVKRAVAIKAGVVGRDEQDRGERSLLNFGHTIGHALEKISDYSLLHGYAVAYGILVEATISRQLGLIDSDQLNIIKKIFSRLGIHGKYLSKFDIADIIQATRIDKKIKNNKVHYVLLKTLGSPHIINDQYVHPVTNNIIRLAYKKAIEG